MISADLKFEGFDAHSWTNLISLFSPGIVARIGRPPSVSDGPEIARDEAEGTRVGALVVVVDDHDRVLKSFHSTRGRVTDLQYEGPDDMPHLTEQYGARRTLVLREGVMDEVSERLALRLERGDDYVTQWLALARILREMQDARLIHLWPRPLANVPVPSPGTVRRAVDLVLPDDHAMLFVLWDRSTHFTSVALRRRGGVIDLVAGPDLISQWTGPLGGDFRRDHRIVVDAVSRAVAPVHLGVFSQVSTMKDLLREASPGQWARATAVRDVIIHPTPPYAAVALGADAIRGVASGTRRLLGGLDLFQAVTPLTDLVRNRVAQVASVTETLGFDPLEALSAVLRRETNSDGEFPDADS